MNIQIIFYRPPTEKIIKCLKDLMPTYGVYTWFYANLLF